MNTPYQYSPEVSQRGLTLIEVMVALTVGLILLIALGSMLVGAIRHYKVQDDFSRMQENGAYALNSIGTDVRMAGFYGEIGTISLVAADNTPLPQTPSANDCSLGWATAVDQPLFGIDPTTPALANTALNCISTANFLTNSPILLLRGGTGATVTATQANTLYIQASPSGGVLFSGESYPGYPAAAPVPLPTPFRTKPDGITPFSTYPYQVHLYYLRPCSRPTGAGGTCQATDDDGKPVPTLVRQELTQGVSPIVMNEQPVAEGIERLSVMYGEDLDGDGFPNIYRNAASVVTWSNVVTVRVAVLARSTTPAKGYNDSAKSYDLGDGSGAVTCAGTDCSYHRHLFAHTYQARNVSQRKQ